MVTVYRKDDPAAPALTYGTLIANMYPQFKTVIKACLVNGYAGKPAAGWSLVAEGSTYLVLRNGTASGYVCFSGSLTTNRIDIYLSETYTGMSGNVPTGAGVKSGTAASNAAPQGIRITHIAYSNTGTCSWAMVADEKTFVLNFSDGAGQTFAVTLAGSIGGGSCPLLYVGEDSGGNFIAVGGLNSAVSNTNPDNYFSATGFTSLRNPSTGLLVDSGSLAVQANVRDIQASITLGISIPNVWLSRVFWVGGGVYGGSLRGVAEPAGISAFYHASAAAAMGFSGTYNSRTAHTPIALGDAYTYILTAKFTASSLLLLTDRPEFW